MTQPSSAQGSGKTLAFGLPILQLLHGEAPGAAASAPSAGSLQTGANPEAAEGQEAPAKLGHSPLRALILEPTRELAMQVLPSSRQMQCSGMHHRAASLQLCPDPSETHRQHSSLVSLGEVPGMLHPYWPAMPSRHLSHHPGLQDTWIIAALHASCVVHLRSRYSWTIRTHFCL